MAEEKAAEAAATSEEVAPNETEVSTEQEFSFEDFNKDLETEPKTEDQPYKEPDLHPLERLAREDILTDAFLTWRQTNLQGDFADFVAVSGYANNQSIEALIEQEAIEDGKEAGLSKDEINELIEDKKNEYLMLDGTKKKIFENKLKKSIKPKEGVYQEAKKKFAETQLQRQKEQEYIQNIIISGKSA